MDFPLMFEVRQRLISSPLQRPEETLGAGLERTGFLDRLTAGSRVAIAAGSRNADGTVRVLSCLVSRIRKSGSEPFVVPAMGSHGGATPEGQTEVLRSLGISEESVGAPIVSTMETVSLGETPGGAGVYVDKAAMGAGSIVVVNRVAPHTGYSGPIQSGLCKMMAVGLGNRNGATALHHHGFLADHLIGEMAERVIEEAPVALGVALLEDGTRRLSRVEALEAKEITKREPGLLRDALEMRPRLPVSSADILIVDEMGKDISGIGMDPEVTGRGKRADGESAPGFTSRVLVTLGLTAGSKGNATGVGHADIITEGLRRSIDPVSTYRNVLTSGALERARIPMVVSSDKEALEMALESLGGVEPGGVRVVRIRNTSSLGDVEVSGALVPELSGLDSVEVVGEGREMKFDRQGNIL